MKPEVTKDSTLDTLKDHDRELRTYVANLLELYDADRDGDDYWTSYGFGDGSFADINVWIEDYNGHAELRVAIYCVKAGGFTDTANYRVIHKQTVKAHTYRDGETE